MKEKSKPKLTLDRSVTYQIKVPGEPNARWADRVEQMAVLVELDDGGLPVTTLTTTTDQAGLLGLLRRLYSLGLPLISVILVDC
jgi:hypothetical protein